MSKCHSRSSSPTDLWYPSLIIPLSSSFGQKLFLTSFHKSYDRLINNFEGQEQLSYCGIACASTLLNSLIQDKRWKQSDIYENIAKDYMPNGIVLSDLSYVIKICGLYSIIRYSNDHFFEEQFLKDIEEENTYLIINYWRQYFIEEKDYIHQGGHFSLIGGYNKQTDDVLLLDPNDQRFPHHWISFKYLIQMMSTIDRMASMPRGYLLVFDPNYHFKYTNPNQTSRND